jgi:hypothetical protein
LNAPYADCVQAASADVARKAWVEAAQWYVRAATEAASRASVEQAWSAWVSAGECSRRADLPEQARRCFARALDLCDPDGTAAARTAPGLAAALGDLGAAEEAEELMEALAAEQGARPLPAPWLDTRIGLLVALGRKEGARVHAAALDRDGSPEAKLAQRFRAAQFQVLDGDLTKARSAWRKLAASLQAEDGAQAGVAAALDALAEVAMLQGEEREALDHFAAAAAAARSAGRAALAWGAEAGQVEAQVALGVQPLSARLDEGVAWAEDRSMMPLASRLRMARGLARVEREPGRAEEDLAAASDMAMASNLPLLVGRAALTRALRLPVRDEERRNLLDTASIALVSHVPLAARAALARARHLARTDPAQARTVARTCLPRLEAMGMGRDILAARALVRQLGGMEVR